MIIKIGEHPVGHLRHRAESWAFETIPEYRKLYPRPVLGQIFEDDLERIWRSRLRLSPFFSNLLPEGPLRELIAREIGVHPEREGFILARLGKDLPGAVEVDLEEDEELLLGQAKLDEDGAPAADEDEIGLKFSLAGVQLKLSALGDRRGLTVPGSGLGGKWIIKLPLPQHPALPSVEYSVMRWAAEAGFEVPDTFVVNIEDIGNLPADWPVRTGEALAIRRFDRKEGGERVHHEDFAQVIHVYPTPQGKYSSANHEVLGRIILSVCGEEGFAEYVRRLVFMVLSGNGDAHLKNWSLLYPDGRSACLTPLYDQVFTKAFLPNDSLALKLGDEREFHRINANSFRRFAAKVRTSEEAVTRIVTETADRVREAWNRASGDLPLDERVRRELDDHLSLVHL